LIVVVGDCNAAPAAVFAGKLSNVPVAHLEAGLRSGDRTMPEENNRIITDALSDICWMLSLDAELNLAAEGISRFKMTHVGNIMIDTIEMMWDKINSTPTQTEDYALVTLHRPSNVDDPIKLEKIVKALNKIAEKIEIIFPVHPRTAERLKKCKVKFHGAICIEKPNGYVNSLALIKGANFVITDSGGIQEETTYLKVPCFTLRNNTERPITEDSGTNRLVTVNELHKVTEYPKKSSFKIKHWDGCTSQRIIEDIKYRFNL